MEASDQQSPPELLDDMPEEQDSPTEDEQDQFCTDANDMNVDEESHADTHSH